MNNLVNFLKQSDIFYQFTPTQLELVANLCQEVEFEASQVIFQENSSSKDLYVIVQGEVDILINRGTTGSLGKSETVIARLRRGQSIGSGRRDHTYHRFIMLGIQPRYAVLSVHLMGLLISALAFLTLYLNPFTALIFFAGSIVGGLAFLFWLER